MRGFEGGAFDEALVKNYPTGEILERYLLLAANSGGDIVPTIGGLLLFGHDESVGRLLPRSSVIATRFGGDTHQSPVIERVELRGNLATVYEASFKFIKRYCDLWDARPTPVTSSDAPRTVTFKLSSRRNHGRDRQRLNSSRSGFARHYHATPDIRSRDRDC